MRDPINTDDLNSTDTKKLIEAHELVAGRIDILTAGMTEILEVLKEQKELLKEIKEVVQGT